MSPPIWACISLRAWRVSPSSAAAPAANAPRASVPAATVVRILVLVRISELQSICLRSLSAVAVQMVCRSRRGGMERGPGPLPTGWAPWMVNNDHAGARRPEPGCAMAHTILIVEDELKIRELLRRYFEREGFAVVPSGSGAEGHTLAGSPQHETGRT